MERYRHRVAPLLILLAVLLLVGYTLRPAIIALITAAVFAYLLHPAQQTLSKSIRSKRLAALIITLILLITIFTPLLFITRIALQEISKITSVLPERTLEEWVSLLAKELGLHLTPYQTTAVTSPIREILQTLPGYGAELLLRIPSLIVVFTIFIFTHYYFLLEGEKLANFLVSAIPIRPKHRQILCSELRRVVRGVVVGHLLTCLLQGLIGGFGWWLFGFPQPILATGLMILAAMVPTVGSAIVYAPFAAYVAMFKPEYTTTIAGHTLGNVATALLFLGYCIFFVSTLDNIYRPILVGTQAKIHPAITIVGTISGMVVFGIIGFVLGPLILETGRVFVNIFREEYLHQQEQETRVGAEQEHKGLGCSLKKKI